MEHAKLEIPMHSMKFILAGVMCLGFGQGATPRDAAIAGPAAVATGAETNYCFARVRGLDPGRQPPAYLVAQLHVRVSYRNAGTRPLILPLERERTVYRSLKPGPMTVFHGLFTLLEPSYGMMKDLPADVSPDNPIDPKNDVFAVIPAGGEMMPPLTEDIVMPVDRHFLFGKDVDLRGRRVYLRLKFVHRELSSALKASLSDRWARFGVPWTGTLMTNTFVIDIPAAPQAAPCKDTYNAAGAEAPVGGK
jgi:hypothetical protein